MSQSDPFGSADAQHAGYLVDYVIRLKGDVAVQNADYRGRLRDYLPGKTVSCCGLKPFTVSTARWSSA